MVVISRISTTTMSSFKSCVSRNTSMNGVGLELEPPVGLHRTTSSDPNDLLELGLDSIHTYSKGNTVTKKIDLYDVRAEAPVQYDESLSGTLCGQGLDLPKGFDGLQFARFRMTSDTSVFEDTFQMVGEKDIPAEIGLEFKWFCGNCAKKGVSTVFNLRDESISKCQVCNHLLPIRKYESSDVVSKDPADGVYTTLLKSTTGSNISVNVDKDLRLRSIDDRMEHTFLSLSEPSLQRQDSPISASCVVGAIERMPSFSTFIGSPKEKNNSLSDPSVSQASSSSSSNGYLDGYFSTRFSSYKDDDGNTLVHDFGPSIPLSRGNSMSEWSLQVEPVDSKAQEYVQKTLQKNPGVKTVKITYCCPFKDCGNVVDLHDESRTPTCKKCNFVLPTKHPIVIVKQDMLKCLICDKKFEKKSHFTRHIKDMEDDRHQNYKPYACRNEGCIKIFRDEANRTKHEKASCTTLSQDERDKHKFKCPHVDCIDHPGFSRKADLQNHSLSKHGGDRTPHKCKYCEKRFANQPNVNRHIRDRHKDLWLEKQGGKIDEEVAQGKGEEQSSGKGASPTKTSKRSVGDVTLGDVEKASPAKKARVGRKKKDRE